MASFIDTDSGFAIARMGFSHQNPVPWENDGTSDQPFIRSFFAGPVHEFDASKTPLPAHDQSWDEYLAAIPTIRGFFAAVLHMPSPERTLIAVDRRASQPVYYVEHAGLLLFAPEVKALLILPDLLKELNWTALAVFWGTGFMPPEQTLFDAIHRLPGGHTYLLSMGNFNFIATGPSGQAPLKITPLLKNLRKSLDISSVMRCRAI